MSNINLLPLNEREKELHELKNKLAEKSQIKIELSNPNHEARPEQERLSFFIGLKKYFKDLFFVIKNKFQKKEVVKPVPNQALEKKPLIPEHKDNNFKNITPQKFFYQTGERLRPHDLPVIHAVPPPKQPPEEKIAPASAPKIIPTIPNLPIIKPFTEIKTVKAPEPNIGAMKESDPLANTYEEDKLVINLIPSSVRKLAKEQLKIKILAIALIACLITSGAVYLILDQIARRQEALFNQLEKEISVTEAGIKELQTGGQEIRDFSALLHDVKNLLDKHIISTNIFKFLETNTLSDAAYSDLSLDPALLTVGLKASTRNYQNLAEQILIFQSLPAVIESVAVDGIALKKAEEETEDNKPQKPELVVFNLSLKFKPDFFLIQP